MNNEDLYDIKELNLSNEEPFNELVRDLCSVVPKSSGEVRKRLAVLLRADRKERAGVVVREIGHEIKVVDQCEENDYRLGYRAALVRVAEIIQDVM